MANSYIEYVSCQNRHQFEEELQNYGQVLSMKELNDKHSPEHHIVVGTVRHVYKFVSNVVADVIKIILEERHVSGQERKFFFGYVFNEIAIEVKNVNLKPGDRIAFRSGYVQNTRFVDVPPYLLNLEVILGYHHKNGEKLFLMKITEHVNVEKSSHGETAGAAYKPQSIAKDDPKKMYRYKKISEINDIGSNVNLYGVIKGVIKIPTLKERHGIVAVVDETCVGNKDFLVHIFCKNDTKCLVVSVHDIIRFHRMKVEKHRDKLDGRVFSSYDVVIFPPDGKDSESAHSTAQSYHFSSSDAARLAELRRWKMNNAAPEVLLSQSASATSSSQDLPATAFKDIRRDGTYKLVCKVLNKEMTSDGVLVLTVADGTLQPILNSYKVKINIADPEQFKQLKVSSLVLLENVIAENSKQHTARPILCFKMSGLHGSYSILRGNDFRAMQLKRKIQDMNEMLEDTPINTAEEYLCANLSGNTPEFHREENCADSESEVMNIPVQSINATPEKLQQNVAIPHSSNNSPTTANKNLPVIYPLSPSRRQFVLKNKQEFERLMDKIHKKVVKTHCTPIENEQISVLHQKMAESTANSQSKHSSSQANSANSASKNLLECIIEDSPSLYENNQEPVVSKQLENNSPLKILLLTDEGTKNMEQSTEQNNLRTRSEVAGHSSESQVQTRVECQDKIGTLCHKQGEFQQIERSVVELSPMSDFSDNPSDVEVSSYVKNFTEQKNKRVASELDTETYSQFSITIRSKQNAEYFMSTQLSMNGASTSRNDTASDNESEKVPSSSVDENECPQRFIAIAKLDSRSCFDNSGNVMSELRGSSVTSNNNVPETSQYASVNKKLLPIDEKSRQTGEPDVFSDVTLEDMSISQECSVNLLTDNTPNSLSSISVDHQQNTFAANTKNSSSDDIQVTNNIVSRFSNNKEENVHNSSEQMDISVERYSSEVDSRLSELTKTGTQSHADRDQQSVLENHMNSTNEHESLCNEMSECGHSFQDGPEEEIFFACLFSTLESDEDDCESALPENKITEEENHINRREFDNSKGDYLHQSISVEKRNADKTMSDNSERNILPEEERNVDHSDNNERDISPQDISVEECSERRVSDNSKISDLPKSISVVEGNAVNTDRRVFDDTEQNILPQNVSGEERNIDNTKRKESNNSRRDVFTQYVCVEGRNADNTDRRESDNSKKDTCIQYMSVEESNTDSTDRRKTDNSSRDVFTQYVFLEGRNADNTDRREFDISKRDACTQYVSLEESNTDSTDRRETDNGSRDVFTQNVSVEGRNADNIDRREFDNSKRDACTQYVSLEESNTDSTDRRETDNSSRDVFTQNVSVEGRNADNIDRREFDNSKRDACTQYVSLEESNTDSTDRRETDNSSRDVFTQDIPTEARNADDTCRSDSDSSNSVNVELLQQFWDSDEFVENVLDSDDHQEIHSRDWSITEESSDFDIADEPCQEHSRLRRMFAEDHIHFDITAVRGNFASGILRQGGLTEYCFHHIKSHINEVCLVKGWLRCIEPSLYKRFPMNDIVSGVCYKCTEACSFMGLEEYDPKTHTVLCSVCLQKGIRNMMVLKFVFRLHLVDEEDNKLIVTVSSWNATQFLGYTAIRYLQDERIFHRINNMFSQIMLPKYYLPVIKRGPMLRLKVTPFLSRIGQVEYTVHDTYLHI